VAAEVNKEEVTIINNKGEVDNIMEGGRMGGNRRLAPGCRSTTSNIKMGCMSLPRPKKEHRKL